MPSQALEGVIQLNTQGIGEPVDIVEIGRDMRGLEDVLVGKAYVLETLDIPFGDLRRVPRDLLGVFESEKFCHEPFDNLLSQYGSLPNMVYVIGKGGEIVYKATWTRTNVKTRLHRARLFLRGVLADYFVEKSRPHRSRPRHAPRAASSESAPSRWHAGDPAASAPREFARRKDPYHAKGVRMQAG